MYPDYNNGLTNLACSILKYYGAEYKHNTLKAMDLLLEHSYKNVIVMVFDGMGIDTLRHHLPENSFLRKHLHLEYSSVFPPTTTSATTTLETGLTPAEHGWLGWSLYFSEIDKIVNAFINTEKFTNKTAADYHVAHRYLPYKSIYEKINETGNAKAYSVSKFGSNHISTLEELIQKVTELCNTDGRKYIYTYWEEPDFTMHYNGCYCEKATKLMEEIDLKVQQLCSKLEDTLVIVTADHGHCNLEHYTLSDYPEIEKMLKRSTSIEPRAAAFHIKQEYLQEFPEKFKARFGEDFLLLSRQQIKEQMLFGDGRPHQKFDELMGDFLAIAISDKGLLDNSTSKMFASNHAGITDKEMIIPFIAIQRM